MLFTMLLLVHLVSLVVDVGSTWYLETRRWLAFETFMINRTN